MRFDCGETWSEKWTRRCNWHPWFAWYPVRIHGTHDCRWLETVERKFISAYPCGEFEYRLPPHPLGAHNDGNK